MTAWRRTPVKERPIAWLLQETHVQSTDEATALQAEWKRMWGQQYQHPDQELSYWSVDDSKRGGVAILLNPSGTGKATPWRQRSWTNRCISLQLPNYLLVNVYAPNDRVEREDFFTGLIAMEWPHSDVVLAGDFNCVQSPALDRLGGRRSGRPESPALQQSTEELHLEDALTLSINADDEDEGTESITHFTYWGPEVASRIDRFYLPVSWTSKVQWIEAAEPAASSDHQRVRLHYREPGTSRPQKAGTTTGALPNSNSKPSPSAC
jgi:exonuclease III